MRLYVKEPDAIVRVTIKQQGVQSEHFALIEAKIDVVELWAKSIIQDSVVTLDPFLRGKLVTVELRECLGGKNGKTKQFSFYGVPPSVVKEFLFNSLKEAL